MGAWDLERKRQKTGENHDSFHPRSPQSNVCISNSKLTSSCLTMPQDDLNPARHVRQRIRGPNEFEEPTFPPLTISSSSDEDIYCIIATWRTCLRLFADSCAVNSETFVIQGVSLEAISSGFLSFLQHLSHVMLSSHHVWELPLGVSQCGPPEFRSLLKQVISFEA